MRMTKSRRFRFLAMLALLSGLLGFSVQAAGSGDAKRTVRIPYGINDQLYADENGEITGYSKDYLDQLAAVNGWEYEYVEANWTEAVEMLQDGRIDLLFPTAKSQEREETMDFPSMATGYIASGLFARADSTYDYEDYESFDGARIAVTENSSNNEELQQFAQEHGFAYEPVYIGSVQGKIQALEDGTVDMIMFSAANEVKNGALVAVFDAHSFYYAVKKGNDALLEELDSGMKTLLMEEPELVASMMKSYLIGTNGSKIAFTAEEREFITSGDPVRVGIYEDTEPLAYLDSEGKPGGIYVELLETVQRETGLNIQLVPISRDQSWQTLMKDGVIDFCIGSAQKVAQDDTAHRSTDAIMDYSSVLITRGDYDMDTEETHTLALTSTRVYWADALPGEFGQLDYLYCRTAKDCLLAVKNGDADMTLINNIEYNYQSKNSRFTDLVQWENYRYQSTVCMTALSDIDPVKFSATEKALRVLSDSQISDITNTCLNMSYESSDLSDYLYLVRYPLGILTVILLMTVVMLFVLYQFRRKQRQAQEEVRLREKRQLSLLAALSMDYVSVYYVNLDTDTFTIERMSGKLRGEVAEFAKQSMVYSAMMEKYISDFVEEEYREALRALYPRESLLDRFQTTKDVNLRYRVRPNSNGQEFFELHFVDVSENDGEHAAVLGFRCVDEIAREELETQEALKEAFEAANQANHAKSEFLSRMSHDIRTPINAIVGMTALAGAHIDDKTRVLDSLSKIASSSRYLLRLINEVLDMSKIESGKLHLSEEDFNLPELVNRMIAMEQSQIRRHGHELQVYIQDIVHENVVGDSLRIQQVFTNIMSNAIKYTPDHGRITVTVREKPYNKHLMGCYEFVFADTGVGMTQEYIDKHLFEAFSRAEDVRISKTQGTGLGMPIAQNIVQMMNGTIGVKSEVGKGSVFTVTIFLRLQDKQPDGAPDLELEGLPVLVADDDQISCEYASQMLTDIGMDAEWVLSGEDAVRRVETRHQTDEDYYAILLDWKMPDMDGVETARAIRKAVGPDISIIILTAYDWSEVEEEARAAGVNAFLSKPVYKSELARTFQRLRSSESLETDASERALEAVVSGRYSGRVLLVEDNDLNREIAAEILQMAGLTVDEAVDGRDAVDRFSASEIGCYDMIFMDIQMPVMNGYEASRAIRALKREDAASVPIAAMTANAFVEDMQAAQEAGMNEYLTKPLEFDKLKAVLEKYL